MLRLLALAAVIAAVPRVSAQGTLVAQGALVTNDPSLCLALTGRTVTTRACSPSLSAWSARYYDRNAFVLQSGNGCLDAYRGSGQPVEVVGCDGSLEQDWFLNTTGQIQNKRYRDLCLDVEGGLGANRRVLAYGCDFNGNEAARRANQRFYLGVVRGRRTADRAVSVPSIAGTPFAGVGFRGAAVISTGGGNVISTGGGNVISTGGGN